jgi:UDP-glucuronate decarboxylase
MQRLFLTGGTGFFGCAILRYLLRNEIQGNAVPAVTVLTRSSQTFLSSYPEFRGIPWLHFHDGDILSPNSLPINQTFTHVLHAATSSTDGPNLSPLFRYTEIVDGTRNILDLAVSSGAKRFLLTSSGGVYGPQLASVEKITEDFNGIPDPMNPENAYSMAKRTAEHLCALYQGTYGIEIVIARCFAFVGRDLPLDAHFAIGNFIRDALWRETIVVKGDGTALRSYLDQRDLAEWLMTLIQAGKAGRAYNVGSDRAVSIADLADIIRDSFAPDKSVTILKDQHRALRNRYIPDIQRARTELGLDIRVSLEHAISDVGQYWLNLKIDSRA